MIVGSSRQMVDVVEIILIDDLLVTVLFVGDSSESESDKIRLCRRFL